MKFASFLEFVDRCKSGAIYGDQTYKNYDLLRYAGDRQLKRTLRFLGLDRGEISVSLAECATRIRERGYDVTETETRQYLIEWYVWHRIEGGELRKWTYAKTTN